MNPLEVAGEVVFDVIVGAAVGWVWEDTNSGSGFVAVVGEIAFCAVVAAVVEKEELIEIEAAEAFFVVNAEDVFEGFAVYGESGKLVVVVILVIVAGDGFDFGGNGALGGIEEAE